MKYLNKERLVSKHQYGKPMRVMLTANQLRLIDNAIIHYSAGFGMRQDTIAKLYQGQCQEIRDIIKPIINKENFKGGN